MEIKGLLRTSLIDYPGKIAAVVFLSRCNMNCFFCYNRDLVLDSSRLPAISEKEFLKFLEERKGLLDGVVITGGEPTLHEGLLGFISQVKTLGFLVKLDTNGTNPDLLKDAIDKKLVDFIAMDVKAPLDSYPLITNVRVDIEKLKQSIKLVKESGIDYEFRTTVVQEIHNAEIIKKLTDELKPAKKYVIQNFRPVSTIDPDFLEKKPFTKEELDEMKTAALKYVNNVEVRY